MFFVNWWYIITVITCVFSDAGCMGLCCYEEDNIIAVHIYKDNVKDVTALLQNKLRPEQFKQLMLVEQTEKLTPSGDPIEPIEICKLDISYKGNVGIVAEVCVGGKKDWFVVTCKHVLGSHSSDPDVVHAVQINDRVITEPKIYSALFPDNSGYFVDVALVKIDDDIKIALTQNNYIAKHLKMYCKTKGCKHVKVSTCVTKTGTKTQTTYGRVKKLDIKMKNFDKYWGKVCLVVSGKDNKFNIIGDSGSMVVTDMSQCAHAIGLISSQIENFNWPDSTNRNRCEIVHATFVVYLDTCIEALQLKYPEIQDIKIVCDEGQYLNLCN